MSGFAATGNLNWHSNAGSVGGNGVGSAVIDIGCHVHGRKEMHNAVPFVGSGTILTREPIFSTLFSMLIMSVMSEMSESLHWQY